MATKVDDLVNRIRELAGDCEIQRFEILGLRDDLATVNAEIERLTNDLIEAVAKKGSEKSPTP